MPSCVLKSPFVTYFMFSWDPWPTSLSESLGKKTLQLEVPKLQQMKSVKGTCPSPGSLVATCVQNMIWKLFHDFCYSLNQNCSRSFIIKMYDATSKYTPTSGLVSIGTPLPFSALDIFVEDVGVDRKKSGKKGRKTLSRGSWWENGHRWHQKRPCHKSVESGFRHPKCKGPARLIASGVPFPLHSH